MEMNGINFNYGLQYTESLKNNYFLNAGISITPGKTITQHYQQLSYKYTHIIPGILFHMLLMTLPKPLFRVL